MVAISVEFLKHLSGLKNVDTLFLYKILYTSLYHKYRKKNNFLNGIDIMAIHLL